MVQLSVKNKKNNHKLSKLNQKLIISKDLCIKKKINLKNLSFLPSDFHKFLSIHCHQKFLISFSPFHFS